MEFVNLREFIVEFLRCRLIGQQVIIGMGSEFVVSLTGPDFLNKMGCVKERICVAVCARIFGPSRFRVGSGMGPRAQIVEQVPDNVKCDW